MAAAAIARLDCDLLLLQEPSPVQAAEIADDVGEDFRVAVLPCDPGAWADPAAPPAGQRSDGNGFIWRPERLELLGEVSAFWLSDAPDSPDGGLWDGSPFRRTCAMARFKDLRTGQTLCAFSAHFDHEGAQARAESAKLVMRRAAAAGAEMPEAMVVVGGDFNTFPDCGGPETYSVLAEEAEKTGLVDVRMVTGVENCDLGRGGASWEGWPGSDFSREANEARWGAVAGQDSSRFDQLFVARSAAVIRTGVAEEPEWRGASDHLPIVAEMTWKT